ncbi:MAG: BACON domain-containing protein [Alistipes sp.]|nr:BACON domain-containing protein [Alistipes sp.]
MKLKNLFYLLLALPLVFAACDKGSEDTDKAPEKEYAAELTLTSEATMEVAAEAGDYEITYTAKMVEVTREAAPATVSANCADAWVTIGEVTDTKAAFSVAANDGEARETKVVVTYADKKLEVAVKQAAKDQGENPETVNFEANYLVGEYFTDGDVGFYYIMFYDLEEDGYYAENATVYMISLFGEKYTEEWSELMPLPTGEFTFDATDSGEIGTFSCEEGGYCAPGAEDMLPFEAGKFVVTENDVTLTVTIAGVQHVVTFDGEPMIYNTDGPTIDEPDVPVVPGEPVAFAPVKVISSHKSDWAAGNFMLDLYVDDTNYHEFDVYDTTANANHYYLSNGTYSSEDETINVDESKIYNGTKNVGVEAATLAFAVNDDWTVTIKGSFESVEGVVYNIDWTGNVDGIEDPSAPEVFKVKQLTASTDDGLSWELVFIEDYAYFGDPQTRIYVDLAETNASHVTAGTYTIADGSIKNTSFYRANRSEDGGQMTACELTVVIDKENETAKLSGTFSAAGKNFTFEWNGVVEGFRYNEVVSGGVTDWKTFEIDYQDTLNYMMEDGTWVKKAGGRTYVLAETESGSNFKFCFCNHVDPEEGSIAAGTYVVATYNYKDTAQAETRFIDNTGGIFSHESEINGLTLTSGEVVVAKDGANYTITFDLMVGQISWTGSYTGTL